MCAYRNTEQQISESSPRQVSPLPSSITFLRATGECTFSSSSPKPGVNIHPKGRKQTLGLLFRTNSCSSQRLFSLAEPRGLFIASQSLSAHRLPSEEEGHLEHLEKNPRLSMFDKPVLAHVGLRVENAPANKATGATGGGWPHAAKAVPWTCQSCCQRQPQLLSNRHETLQHPCAEPD